VKHTKEKKEKRLRRHKRIRNKVFGTADSPRFCVFRSNKNMYCQLIDDEAQRTVACASTMEKEMREKMTKSGNKEAAREIGKRIAQKAKALGIDKVHFDRAGYKYHGRVKEMAEGAREGGLKF
jgi:large subunit ribosomal protein L18